MIDQVVDLIRERFGELVAHEPPEPLTQLDNLVVGGGPARFIIEPMEMRIGTHVENISFMVAPHGQTNDFGLRLAGEVEFHNKLDKKDFKILSEMVKKETCSESRTV